jgi:serine protease Do
MDIKIVKQSLLRSGIMGLLLSLIFPLTSLHAQEGDFSRQYKKVLPKVVTIEGSEMLGSGFYIDSDRLVTNAHVVKSDQKVQIIRADGEQIEGSVEWRDSNEDIAFVTIFVDNFDTMASKDYEASIIQGIPPGALPLSTTLPEIGTRVYVIGSPGIGPGTPATGTLTSGIVSKVWEKDGIVQFDAAVNHGNSGGPILNSRGEVIGMVQSGAKDTTGLNFAISTQRIMAALLRCELQEAQLSQRLK